MYNFLTALSWGFRGNSIYDLSQAKNTNDVLNVFAVAISSEIIFSKLKQQDYKPHYRN